PKPKVNNALPTPYSYFKAHSPVKRAFNQKSAAKTNKFNEKVNTARVNNVTTARPKAVVSAAVRNGENVVKFSACWTWRPTENVIDHTSKDNGSYMLKRFYYVDLQGRLNVCSWHITENKSFLIDYQEIDGGFVAYGRITAGNQTNKNASIKDNTQQYILLPLLYDSLKSLEDAVADDAGSDDQNVQDFIAALDNLLVQQKEGYANNTNRDSTVSAARQSFTNADDLLTDPLMPDLEDTGIFSGAYDDEDVGVEADLNNLEITMNVYVDDIIFGSTKKSLCVEFEQMMHKRFQMSSIGELTFFLGLQVKQKDNGIFIS
ncbi:ribonuclease H-like domain-containing protein, partial [Tanacetum coccineum]